MFRSASSKSPGRARVLKALPPGTALLAALLGVALLAIGAQPAAAQEQTADAVVAWGV